MSQHFTRLAPKQTEDICVYLQAVKPSRGSPYSYGPSATPSRGQPWLRTFGLRVSRGARGAHSCEPWPPQQVPKTRCSNLLKLVEVFLFNWSNKFRISGKHGRDEEILKQSCVMGEGRALASSRPGIGPARGRGVPIAPRGRVAGAPPSPAPATRDGHSE